MKIRTLTASTLLLLTSLALAACSGITRVRETPQLGVSTSGAPTATLAPGQPTLTAAPATGAATAGATEEPEPTQAPPTPTASLPEGVIALPTLPRTAATVPPNTPSPIFPEGALEATLAAQPALPPQVGIYNAVYQRYEHGAMLYIAEMRQIWVMVESPGRRGGPYYRFDDLFMDGDAESIEGLEPPPGLLQPHRGFGRIWREQPQLRASLGWAADFEIPFSMHAARVQSGAFDAAGNFVLNGSLWMMTLHENSLAYFNEVSNTWAVGATQ